MSTSPSDPKGGSPSSGVGSMFKRAVVAHTTKTEASGVAPVREGIEQVVCSHCGAPRHDQERICRFCQKSV